MQIKHWKHRKRRNYVKRLKRSIKRKEKAKSENWTYKSFNFSSESINFADEQQSHADVKFHGFQPLYDFIVHETVSLVVKNLVTLVCKDESYSSQSSPINASTELNNEISSTSLSLSKANNSISESISSLTHSGNEGHLKNEAVDIMSDDVAKAAATEKFLEELDEEVKNWHNPFLPESAQDVVTNLPSPDISSTNTEFNSNAQVLADSPAVNKQLCQFYEKVGSCRFGDNCSRHHEKVDASTTLLLSGMFNTFAFDIVDRARKTFQGDVDDLWLEHSDTDLYDEFVEFYNDVIPELETYGKVIQFKVCCNRDKHLLGNVYVQYKHQNDAKRAAESLNGRFYGGKALTVKYVLIKSWKSAICGLHYHNRNCPRGHHCNFLHVFKEPSRRFYDIDTDFATQKYHRSDCYSERSSRHRYSERSHNREKSRKRLSLTPPLYNSPDVGKKRKKSVREHKHKKSSKIRSKKHKHKKDRDNNSS